MELVATGMYAEKNCCKLRAVNYNHYMRHRLSMREVLGHHRLKSIWRSVAFGFVVLSIGACQTIGGQKPPESSSELVGLQSTLYSSARDAEATNEYGKAAVLFARLMDQRPDDPVILASFVRNMRYSGNQAGGIQWVEQHVPKMLEDSGVKFEYAKALLAAGRSMDALNYMQDVAAEVPGDWRVQSALGVVNDTLGHYDVALQAYARALRLSPNNAVILNNKAMSQAMAGHLDAAIVTLKRAAELNRQNSSIRQNLALLYAIDGNLESAKALASMDLDLDDLDTNLSFYRRFEGERR